MSASLSEVEELIRIEIVVISGGTCITIWHVNRYLILSGNLTLLSETLFV